MTYRPPDPERIGSPSAKRIAIIGAGAAGLSAAYYLWKKGYRRITVFDRRSRVGGKCLTRTFDGRTYELGALVVGNPYHHIRELMAAVGLKAALFPPIALFDTAQPDTTHYVEESFGQVSLATKLRLLGSYFRYRRDLARPGFRRLEETGLAGHTMAAWLQRRPMTDVRSVLTPYYVSWGYGYFERVSAVYVFKLFDFYYRALAANIFFPRHNHPMGFIPEGYQRLWEKIAEPFELCLGSDIRSVRRDATITVATDAEIREFDKLIVACPMVSALSFLDDHPREHALMNKIRTLDFYTVTAAVEGLPPDALVFVCNHLTPASAGHMVSWYRRWPDRNIIVFYIIGAPGESSEDIASRLANDLERIGASLGKIYDQAHWNYFPHVSTQDLARGFYREFEDLQGHRHTWYAGEVLAFPTVEHVVAYSKRLIADLF